MLWVGFTSYKLAKFFPFQEPDLRYLSVLPALHLAGWKVNVPGGCLRLNFWWNRLTIPEKTRKWWLCWQNLMAYSSRNPSSLARTWKNSKNEEAKLWLSVKYLIAVICWSCWAGRTPLPKAALSHSAPWPLFSSLDHLLPLCLLNMLSNMEKKKKLAEELQRLKYTLRECHASTTASISWKNFCLEQSQHQSFFSPSLHSHPHPCTTPAGLKWSGLEII